MGMVNAVGEDEDIKIKANDRDFWLISVFVSFPVLPSHSAFRIFHQYRKSSS